MDNYNNKIQKYQKKINKIVYRIIIYIHNSYIYDTESLMISEK